MSSNRPESHEDFQRKDLQVLSAHENENIEIESPNSNELSSVNKMPNIQLQLHGFQNNNLNSQSKHHEIHQIKRDSLQETSNTFKQTQQAKCNHAMNIIFCLVPFLVFVLAITILLVNSSLKRVMVRIFEHLQGQLSLLNITYLIIFGALSISLSLPYIVFEISLGVTFPFFTGLLIGITSKLLGETICFYLTRYLLKDCILSCFEGNLVFQVLLKASLKHPNTVSHLLRSSFIIPLFIINFGSGILHISFQQYLIPAVIWGIIYSSCSIFVGQQLAVLSEVADATFIPKNKILFYFELFLMIASVIASIVAILKAHKAYQALKEEVEWEETQEQQNKGGQFDKNDDDDCPAYNMGKYDNNNTSRNNLISIGFSGDKTVKISQLEQCQGGNDT